MNYFQLLKESLQTFRENKLAWKLGFLAILANLFPPTRFYQNNVSFLCIGVIVLVILGVISTIGDAGLVFLIHQIRNDRETTFSECWNNGKSKALSIVGLICLSLPAISISYYPFKIYYHKIADTIWPWPLIFLFSTFWGAIITFGTFAIVIDHKKVWPSWWLGFIITTSNLFHLIILNSVFSIIAMFPMLLLLVVFILSPLKTLLPSPLNLNYSIYREILQIPIFGILKKLLGSIIYPWTVIVFMVIYERFAQKYPSFMAIIKGKAT